MLSQVKNLDVTRTGSTMEAAILESDEIKRYSPPYNIALRIRDRNIVYGSKDFERYAYKADNSFPIGPLPTKEPIEALSKLGKLVKNEITGFSADLGATILGIPEGLSPDAKLFLSGFNVFLNRHKEILQKDSFERTILSLGARLWRVKLDKTQSGEQEREENIKELDLTDTDEDKKWTLEDVAVAIENAVFRYVHLIRRARWFCMLSESSLTWESPGGNANEKRRIVFSGGQAVFSGSRMGDESSPVPPGFMRNRMERQQSFDMATYDRMRVVSTELRRLVSEKRKVDVRLKPNVILNHERLERLLQWV